MTTIAYSGGVFRNGLGSKSHALMDNLTIGGDSARFTTRRHPDSTWVLHLPAGAEWDMPNGSKAEPRELSNGMSVDVHRAGQTVYRVEVLDLNISSDPRPDPDAYVLLAGQSMMSGLHARPARMLEKYPAVLIDAAHGGSSLYRYEDANCWLELDGSPGPLLIQAQADIDGIALDYIVWAQGHDNVDEMQNGTLTPAAYKAGVLTVLTALGWPTGPVIIEMPGRITPGFGSGLQAIREVYQDIRDTEANIRAYEVLDQTHDVQDGTHHGATLQDLAAQRAGLLMADPGRVPPGVVSKTAVPDGWLLTFDGPVTAGDFGPPTAWSEGRTSALILNGGGRFAWPDGDGGGLRDIPMDGHRQFNLGGFVCE